MKERVVTFGPERNLVGVLTQPDQVRPDLPVLVFLNAGLLHRVGPYRMHVDLARQLAARGYASLRFDLSGRGDSG
ncbi:MAG TPA: alpha/beta hydrolase, partial [Gammaproteobacteria bacterium]|nr:alpha/beta hydrolase [Gammaproteobacteria bacterium]